MPYNFALIVSKQRNFVADFFSREVRFYTKNGRFAFLSPPLWGLGATYDDHIRLIGKRVVDFLFVLIALFSLGFTTVALRAIYRFKIGDFAPTGVS